MKNLSVECNFFALSAVKNKEASARDAFTSDLTSNYQLNT